MKGLFQCPPEEEGLGEKVEPSLAKEGRGDSKNSAQRAVTSLAP